MPKRIITFIVFISFCLSLIAPYQTSWAAEPLLLPKPGAMVNISPAFDPVVIKGLKIDSKNPFRFEFIIDPGQSNLTADNSELKKESEKLIKYFLASLTVPEKDLWVNLSPYEKDRMIADNLGQTEMGRDMLAQDYLLKQLTASLIYPEKELGKVFWDKVYAKAQALYGTSEIPVNTFNKVWIVADKADVFERENVAYIVGAHLKVMLEEDYLAMDVIARSEAAKKSNTQKIASPKKQARNDPQSLGSQIIRDLVLPELEKEINTGKNFAPLRQMFYSMILASWYKMALKESLIAKIYANKNKIENLKPTRGHVSEGAVSPSSLPSNEVLKVKAPQGNDLNDVEYIYQQYLKAYKKGVFNYIKDDINHLNQTVPRKYFSGGLELFPSDPAQIVHRLRVLPAGAVLPDRAVIAEVDLIPSQRIAASNLKDIMRLMADPRYKMRYEATSKIMYFRGDADKIAGELINNLINPSGIDQAKSAYTANGGAKRDFSPPYSRRNARDATLFALLRRIMHKKSESQDIQKQMAERLNQEAQLWLTYHGLKSNDAQLLQGTDFEISLVREDKLGHEAKRVPSSIAFLETLRLYALARKTVPVWLMKPPIYPWVERSIKEVAPPDVLSPLARKLIYLDRSDEAMAANGAPTPVQLAVSFFKRAWKELGVKLSHKSVIREVFKGQAAADKVEELTNGSSADVLIVFEEKDGSPVEKEFSFQPKGLMSSIKQFDLKKNEKRLIESGWLLHLTKSNPEQETEVWVLLFKSFISMFKENELYEFLENMKADTGSIRQTKTDVVDKLERENKNTIYVFNTDGSLNDTLKTGEKTAEFLDNPAQKKVFAEYREYTLPWREKLKTVFLLDQDPSPPPAKLEDTKKLPSVVSNGARQFSAPMIASFSITEEQVDGLTKQISEYKKEGQAELRYKLLEGWELVLKGFLTGAKEAKGFNETAAFLQDRILLAGYEAIPNFKIWLASLIVALQLGWDLKTVEMLNDFYAQADWPLKAPEMTETLGQTYKTIAPEILQYFIFNIPALVPRTNETDYKLKVKIAPNTSLKDLRLTLTVYQAMKRHLKDGRVLITDVLNDAKVQALTKEITVVRGIFLNLRMSDGPMNYLFHVIKEFERADRFTEIKDRFASISKDIDQLAQDFGKEDVLAAEFRLALQSYMMKAKETMGKIDQGNGVSQALELPKNSFALLAEFLTQFSDSKPTLNDYKLADDLKKKVVDSKDMQTADVIKSLKGPLSAKSFDDKQKPQIKLLAGRIKVIADKMEALRSYAKLFDEAMSSQAVLSPQAQAVAKLFIRPNKNLIESQAMAQAMIEKTIPDAVIEEILNEMGRENAKARYGLIRYIGYKAQDQWWDKIVAHAFSPGMRIEKIDGTEDNNFVREAAFKTLLQLNPQKARRFLIQGLDSYIEPSPELRAMIIDLIIKSRSFLRDEGLLNVFDQMNKHDPIVFVKNKAREGIEALNVGDAAMLATSSVEPLILKIQRGIATAANLEELKKPAVREELWRLVNTPTRNPLQRAAISALMQTSGEAVSPEAQSFAQLLFADGTTLSRVKQSIRYWMIHKRNLLNPTLLKELLGTTSREYAIARYASISLIAKIDKLKNADGMQEILEKVAQGDPIDYVKEAAQGLINGDAAMMEPGESEPQLEGDRKEVFDAVNGITFGNALYEVTQDQVEDVAENLGLHPDTVIAIMENTFGMRDTGAGSWAGFDVNNIDTLLDGSVDTDEVDSAMTNPGGIDLNASHMRLNVTKQGQGVPMSIDQAMVNQEGFDGLEFTIQSLKPVSNLSLYLGMQAS